MSSYLEMCFDNPHLTLQIVYICPSQISVVPKIMDKRGQI